MKLIIAGGTGGIGSAVLTYSISNPSITSIVVLSRRPLPTPPTSPKVKVVILEDFTSYPSSVLTESAGAEACIWAIGVIPGGYPDLAALRRINIDFPLAAAKAFATSLAPQLAAKGKKFQFWFISGRAVEQDQEKSLWLFSDARKVKGETESELIRLEEEHKKIFSTHLVRVGSVLPKSKVQRILGALSSPFYPTIEIETFASVLVEGALKGDAGQVLSHEELVRRSGLEVARV